MSYDPKRLARRWLATDLARDAHGPEACGCDHPELVEQCYAGAHDHDPRLDAHLAAAVHWCRAAGHGAATSVTVME